MHVFTASVQKSDMKLYTDRWWLAGPSTAGGMAAAKGWQSLLVPALLIGTFGYSCATFVALVLGTTVLRGMVVV